MIQENIICDITQQSRTGSQDFRTNKIEYTSMSFYYPQELSLTLLLFHFILGETTMIWVWEDQTWRPAESPREQMSGGDDHGETTDEKPSR